MSYEIIQAAIESERYQGVKKAVVVALCSFINSKRAANGDTGVWPGLAVLCARAGWKRRAVQIAIDGLVADDNPVVEILSQGAGTESTHYFIHADRLNYQPGSSATSNDSEADTSEELHGVPMRQLPGEVRETPGVVSVTHQGGISDTGGGLRETPGVVYEKHPNQEENTEDNKEGTEEGKKEPTSPSIPPRGLSLNSKSKSTPDQGRVTEKPSTRTIKEHTPTVPSCPLRTLPEDFTPEEWEAHWAQFPAEERDARILERGFALTAKRPSKWQDFQRLLDQGHSPTEIGNAITWAVEESGHWQFYNSKHFCKDTVFPVVADQATEWWEKNQRCAQRAAVEVDDLM